MRTVNRHFKPIRTELDGFTFDSKAEALRYAEVKMLLRGGLIKELRVKPRLPMVINGRKIGRGYMILDLSYLDFIDGEWRLVYEDSKSVDTAANKVRRQVCEAINDIHIKVVET